MLSVTIDIADLPGRLQEVLGLARSGTEVVVQDATGPVARLTPITAAPPPRAKREWKLGLHPGAMVMRADFDDYVTEEEFLRGDI